MRSTRWSLARARRRAARPALVAAIAVPLTLPLCGLTQVPGPIRIGPSWGTVDAGQRTGGLYTTLINRGVLLDRLSGGRCPGYGDVALVGVDRATEGNLPQDQGLALAPGSTAVLAPNGPHLALSNTPANLADGALVPCTLSFVHSGERIVVFTLGAAPPRTYEP